MTQGIGIALGSDIIYVAGTVNGVSVDWMLVAANTWRAIVERSADGVYNVSVLAYDDAGNGALHEIELNYGMPHLVYDRTQSDISRRTQKAYWNAEDVNRVESATGYLRDMLAIYGYSVAITTKTDWTMEDYPTRAEVDRIRANIDALQTGFYALPDWREIVYNNTLDFGQANAMEFDLQAAYVWLQRMIANLEIELRSGEIYAG